jgi:hypothetical protein
MSANFRNVAFSVILLTVILAGATSCKKGMVELPKEKVEPWPIAAIWAWHDYITHQDASTPSLVVYSDGRVILKKVSPIDRTAVPFSIPMITFWTKLLTTEELADFQARVEEVVKDPSLEAESMLSLTSDQSSTRFYFGTKGKGFVINVYALWIDQPDDASFLTYQTGMEKLPDSLFQYCAYLPVLIHGELEQWKPEHWVVEFRPSSINQAERPHWPDAWPSPDSSRATVCGERRFVVLGINQQGGLQKLLGTIARDEPIEIEAGGKKYGASYRYHFPREELWYEEWHVCPGLNSFIGPRESFPAPIVPRPAPPKNAFDR